MPFDFGESTVFAGQPVQINCLVVEGDPPLDIHWTFNNSDISARDDITTVRVGKKNVILMIDSADSVHTGIYTCSANNSAGFDSRSASLDINGKHVCLYCINLDENLDLFHSLHFVALWY